MLGEMLGVLEGKTTGQRVLPPDDGAPRVETTFEIRGTTRGVGVTMMGTYWSKVRADGSLYGECPWQGVLMTDDGHVGTWAGTGVGRFTGVGSGVSFRGVVYWQIDSEPLADLNHVAIPYEWDIDSEGNGKASIWEWK